MTASNENNPNPEIPVISTDDTSLPHAGILLLVSLAFTKRHANDLYGFAAYLLFPLILLFATQNVAGTLGNVLQGGAHIVFILTAAWVYITLIILTRMRLGHPKKDPDPRSIGLYAVTTLGTFTFTLLLSGLLQFAGLLLLVLPGVILGILFTFVPECVVLRGCGPLSALATSRKIVQPQFFSILWRLFVLKGSVLGAYFLAVILILLGINITTGLDVLTLATTTPTWLDAILAVVQIAFLPPIIVGHTMLFLSLSEPEEPKETDKK